MIMTRRNNILIAQKDRCSIEMLLRDDDSYEFKPEMANITEIQEFINGLFDLIDEFNVKIKNKLKKLEDEYKEHI